MGKVKKKKVLSNVVGAVSPRASKVLDVAKSVLGNRGGNVRRKSRAFNINKYAKKLLKAKLDAKIMREKLKVLNAVK